MQNQLSLTEVNADFKNWRSNKPYSSEPVPERLRQQAISLLEQYPASKICSTLAISASQFKKWCQLAEIRSTRTEFIELPAEGLVETKPSPIALELRLSNGHQLQLSGHFDIDIITQIIKEVKS